MSYLFKKISFKEKSLYYFHKNITFKKNSKNQKKPTILVGFFRWDFWVGFLLPTLPGRIPWPPRSPWPSSGSAPAFREEPPRLWTNMSLWRIVVVNINIFILVHALLLWRQYGNLSVYRMWRNLPILSDLKGASSFRWINQSCSNRSGVQIRLLFHKFLQITM